MKFGNPQKVFQLCTFTLKVLWILKNIFETLHDSNDSDEKIKMLKTGS